VHLAALDQREAPEGVAHGPAQRLGAVNDEQAGDIRLQPALYFLANTAQGFLGVADPNGHQDRPFATTHAGSHSVAVDPVRNQVYVPFNTGAGIGVYTVTPGTGPDDPSVCVGQGAPVISMGGDEGTGSPVLLRVVCPLRATSDGRGFRTPD
jgi:hypothetical protein